VKHNRIKPSFRSRIFSPVSNDNNCKDITYKIRDLYSFCMEGFYR